MTDDESEREPMNFIVKKISINKLELDIKNPRYPPTNSQDEAFDLMISNIDGEISSIASHLKKYGMNPSTFPIVYEDTFGHYIVKDGNRRVTAIKALMNPKLIPANEKALRDKFIRLGRNIDRSVFRYISCIVFDSEDQADLWVKVNHQGPQKGIGQKKWNPVQKMRDQSNHGIFVPTLDIFEFWQENSNSPVDENEFPLSTFERLVTNKKFRDYIGFEIEDKEIVRYRSREEILKLLKPIIDDIDNKVKTSRSLNDAKSIEKYIDEKKQQNFPTDNTLDTPLLLIDEDESKKNSNVEDRVKIKRNKAGRKKSQLLIDRSFQIDISVSRIENIFTDLRRMDVYKHSNTVSVLFRSFMELSVKYYYDKNKLEKKSSFSERILCVADDMLKKQILNYDQYGSVKLLCKRDDGAIDIAQELNQYGHNYNFNPTAESLKGVWLSLEPFVSAIFMANK